MNTISTSTLGRSILILSSALLATSSEVFAKHPRPRVANGSIEMIDWKTRTLRIKTDVEPLTLVWNDRTLFTAGNRKATAGELARRTPVTVWYYTPWIGERFASRIMFRKDGSLPLRR
jgi:hypothetical protein